MHHTPYTCLPAVARRAKEGHLKPIKFTWNRLLLMSLVFVIGFESEVWKRGDG
jgi:hypothetical protein